MTKPQLDSLTEDELGILFYIVNIVSPTVSPKIEYDMTTIRWMRSDALKQKLVDAFPTLHKDGHATYSSLLAKLGIFIQIKYEESSAPITSSVTSSECSGSASEPTGSQPLTPDSGSSGN